MSVNAKERSANFKAAILATKDSIEKDVVLRQSRQDALEGASRAEVKMVSQLENKALRASCKSWSTADFEPVKVIGQGAFGTVHLVKQIGGEQLYALKQIEKAGYSKKNYRDRLYAERDILTEATSRWFVDLHATFQDDLNVYMVMEFLQGGDLIGHVLKLRRFTQEQTCFYMAELLEALDTVHQRGFVHRDVKPDNVVLNKDGHIKLLDFGLAKQELREGEFPGSEGAPQTPGRTTRAQLKSTVGTPQYMAPESFRGSHGKEADLWALGIMTFECLSGHVPFHSGTKSGAGAIQMIRDQINDHVRLLPTKFRAIQSKGYVNEVSQSFISQLVCSKNGRLNADECRQTPFFQSIDFSRIHLCSPPIVPELSDAADTRYFHDCRVGRRPLPVATASGSKKDAALEWTHYEFDCDASLLNRADLQGVLNRTDL